MHQACRQVNGATKGQTVPSPTTALDCSTKSSNLFFFQAEDGIRDVAVTGVQTCALPISSSTNTRCTDAAGQGRQGSDNWVSLRRCRSDAKVYGESARSLRLPGISART